MKPTKILVAAIALLATSYASASGFEFCDFEGEIQSAREQPKGTYELAVQVAKVSRAKEHGDMSYTDCHEYDGKILQVTFAVSETPRTPVSGDKISFSRSVIDVFNKDGMYAGTDVNTRLHHLRRQDAPVGR